MHYRVGDPASPRSRPALFVLGESRWHALMVYPQREKAGKLWLSKRGVYAFYPVREKLIARQTKHELVNRPYLPGYLFAKFPGPVIDHQLFEGPFIYDGIRLSPSVDGVRALGALHPKSISQLLAMRDVDETIEDRRRAKRIIAKGDRVRILDGAYEGWEVEVVEIGNDAVKFAVTLLGMREVEIEADRVEKVGVAE